MPEYLESRFNSKARWYLATVSIVAYVMTKIAVTIAAGGVVFEALMGIDFWTGASIVVLLTGVYTVIGGLTAVLYTDLIQTIILIAGSLLVTILGLQEIGGLSTLLSSAPRDTLSVWRPISDPTFPWTGIIFGAPILGVWYWCTDQFIVQRVLSARNISHAQGGTIFAGFLKLTPMFLFVLPGLIAMHLSNSGALKLDSPDHALPALIGYCLPTGLRGIVVAGLLAALMSSLSSVFNSCSTLISIDIYKKLKPMATERHVVVVGQLSTIALVILGLLWIPIISKISTQLYHYLQSVQAYIAPPIAAVFILGITTRSTNSYGAIAGLWSGFVAGIARLTLEIIKPDWLQSANLTSFVSMNFLHFAALLFVFALFITTLVSRLTTKAYVSTDAKSEALANTFLSQKAPTKRVLLCFSALLLSAVIGVWIVFSPLFL